jgi:hypothetical protein
MFFHYQEQRPPCALPCAVSLDQMPLFHYNPANLSQHLIAKMKPFTFRFYAYFYFWDNHNAVVVGGV